MRIVVVEDQQMFRALLVRTCREGGHEVVGETAYGADGIALCRELQPEGLLLDVRLPDIDGLNVAKRIATEAPKTRILMITAYASEYFFYRLERIRVAGYVTRVRIRIAWSLRR